MASLYQPPNHGAYQRQGRALRFRRGKKGPPLFNRWIVDYLAMKGLRLKPTLQIELTMGLAIVMVLAALIYYGRLVWLLFSPD